MPVLISMLSQRLIRSSMMSYHLILLKLRKGLLLNLKTKRKKKLLTPRKRIRTRRKAKVKVVMAT
jgi:hypothetical protein